MKLSFKKLNIANFKNHPSLEILFSDITKIVGRNGAGKSTIGDAVTWLLFGTDITGSKLDPKPIGSPDEETKVELLFHQGNKAILLGRSQKKAAKYFINEVPEKAAKFNELVESLFDKNLFLSLFNPAYFSSQHWEDQRSQLLSYVSEPLNKEILEAMDKVNADTLAGPLKKHSLDDLEKMHRERFRTKDKDYDRAVERVKTLKEQLDKKLEAKEEIDVQAIENELKSVAEERDALSAANQVILQTNNQRLKLQSEIEHIKNLIEKQKKVVAAIKSETIEEHCQTCGQQLQEESVAKVKENRQERFNKEISEGKDLVAKGKQLEAQLNLLPPEQNTSNEKAWELDDKAVQLKSLLNQAGQIESLKAEIEESETTVSKVRKERNESQSIVDAIKIFRSKRSELMVSKVDSLFTTISVRLFEQLKNGTERATFEIEMDGKPYSKLSTAEKIKAGLELVEVLSKQSELIVPTFVDNAESILHFTAPTGQLIVARVADQDLSITSESLKSEKEAV